MRLRIALAQFDVAVGDPQQNLARVEAYAGQAAQQGVHLLLLPELWLTGYDLELAHQHALTFEQTYRCRWQDLARATRLYIAGSVLAADPAGRPANTYLLLSPQGEVVATYRKVHLFAPMGEARHLAPGEAVVSVDLPWGRAGLAICYDLRFPELFRRLALDGCAAVLLVAEWPAARLEHWRILLRARAIENQTFLAACNRTGRDPDGTAYAGHSAVIGPWGEAQGELGTESDLLLADIDLEEVMRVRSEFPVLGDRRPALYRLD